MIHYDLFQFASAPRTATAWIRRAAAMTGLVESGVADVHAPFPELYNATILRVGCVRHPCDWLASYWASINPALIGLPEVDAFQGDVSNFDLFVRRYLDERPGTVGKMMTSYNADSYLRIEDLPMAFVEMIDSLGMPRCMAERCIGNRPINPTPLNKRPVWNRQLRDAVIRAEVHFLERFEYWW